VDPEGVITNLTNEIGPRRKKKEKITVSSIHSLGAEDVRFGLSMTKCRLVLGVQGCGGTNLFMGSLSS